MIKCKVKFIGVGRNKFNGVKLFEGNTEEEINLKILAEVKNHLLSNDVSFEDGVIYAGFRDVGKFEFIAGGLK